MGIFTRKKEKLYTEDDMEAAIKAELEKQAFDFSQLWVEPEGGGGFMKFLPAINMILLIITIALVSFK